MSCGCLENKNGNRVKVDQKYDKDMVKKTLKKYKE